MSLQLSFPRNTNATQVHEGPFPHLSTQGTDTGIASGSNLPATNFAAFHKEISTDNNSLQLPKPRRTVNDLKAWPHKGSVTTSPLSVALPAQEIADCVEPSQFSEKTVMISEEQESTNWEAIRLAHYRPAQVL